MSSNNITKEAAEILINIGAVSIRPNKPFTLTSGRLSPVYVDCRRIISFPNERKRLMEMAVIKLNELEINNSFDAIAGGETAGIPFAAWIAELFNLPMLYVRKKPKGFGQNKRIEGLIKPKQNILLVEDLATDGGSKMSFINAIRETGAYCYICFVIFHYGIFQKSIDELNEQNIKLIELATWEDILNVSKEKGMSSTNITKVKQFLDRPEKWKPN